MMTVLRAHQVTSVCAAVVADCACEGLRRAARAISRVYAGALADTGLSATQLAILVATRLRGSLPLSRLAQGLRLDRTSLYRAVRPLERKGYLLIQPGRTQRERAATVTAKGEQILRQALPAWERVQRQFIEALGPRPWAAVSTVLPQIVSVAQRLESAARVERSRRRSRARA